MLSRGYLITLNSKFVKGDDVEEIKNKKSEFEKFWRNEAEKNMKVKDKDCKLFRYIILGPVEFGKKEKRMHLHGYIYCNKQKSIKQLKKYWGNECHFDPAKGSGNQIESYILKGEMSKYESKENPEKRVKPIFEYGEKPLQGNRSDLQSAIDDCETIEDMQDLYPDLYCKYRNGLKDIFQRKADLKRKREFKKPEVIWMYGSTGKGKTRIPFEDGYEDVTYDGRFFTDWKNARNICFEEMNGELPFKLLLKLTDGYHNYYHVNIKGGDKYIDVDKIIITSSYHPQVLYGDCNGRDGSYDQLERRITKIINMDEK